MDDLQRAIATRDQALRRATGVDPDYPDPGEKGITAAERARRSRARLDARISYDVAAAEVARLEQLLRVNA